MNSKYLIIGDGRVARHISHYFNLIGVPHLNWHRKLSAPLSDFAMQTDKALILITDAQIANFVKSQPSLANKTCIHFSGALRLDNVLGLHPLMPFASEMFDLETYKQIPFINEKGTPGLRELMPELSNPQFEIEPEKKSLYHAMCAVGCNFPVLLWQSVLKSFENELHLPKEVLKPCLDQILKNTFQNCENALTGPLSRGDTGTLIKHLDALSGRPEQNIYYAFLNYYLENHKNIGELSYERIRI